MTLEEFATFVGDAASLLPEGIKDFGLQVTGEEAEETLALVKAAATKPVCLILKTNEGSSRVHVSRRFFETITNLGLDSPVIHYLVLNGSHKDDIIITGGAECGALLVDGLGDGVVIEGSEFGTEFLRLTSFGMLQGCRMRSTKTDYVSCPSCGRTLLDLQEVTNAIQEKTGHLPGVTIVSEMEVVGVDKDDQVVTLKDGRKMKYKALLSTIPFDIMCKFTGKPELAAYATPMGCSTPAPTSSASASGASAPTASRIPARSAGSPSSPTTWRRSAPRAPTSSPPFA